MWRMKNKFNWIKSIEKRKTEKEISMEASTIECGKHKLMKKKHKTMNPWRTTKEKVAPENGYTIVTNFPNEGERARDTILGK